MARVKICGINTTEAIEAAAAADWIGFVFFPPSPRAVTPHQAAALSKAGPAGPKRVGLFVDPTDTAITETLGTIPLDVLQVHSSMERAAELRVRFGLPVWYAAGVHSAADLPLAAPGLDAILLDAKAPPGASLPGGNALPFDWTVLHRWAAPVPWLLAGGLTPGNVAEAIQVSQAAAVDVSSGVERTRGVKDPELILAFIRAARSANRRFVTPGQP